MNNLTNTAKLLKINGNQLVFELKDELNIERLKRVFENHDGDRIAEIFFKDPRTFTTQQRAFTFALMRDISIYTGEQLETLKDVFYWQFRYFTGRNISLSNGSLNTVDDVATLDDLILDFIFENNIPFKQGYEIPPQNVQYYFYKCCKNRICMVCGRKNAQIAHYQAVGNRKRRKVDHRQLLFMSLCGEKCHPEQHQIGVDNFCNKYHIKPIKLSENDLIELGVMTRKRMDEIDEK